MRYLLFSMKQTHKDRLRTRIYKGSELSEFLNNALVNISEVFTYAKFSYEKI